MNFRKIIPFVLAAVFGFATYGKADVDTSIQWGIDTTQNPNIICAYDASNVCQPTLTFGTMPVYLSNFAMQAFIALGGNTAIDLAVRFGWQLTPYDFGAVGDGVTDDTTAVQAWVSALASTGSEGFCPDGKYRLTSTVNGFSATNYYHMRGSSYSCVFYVDFNGWSSAAIDLTNPVTPSTRGVSVEWDHFKILYNRTLTAPPTAFKQQFSSDLKLHDYYFSQYTVNRGTCLSISDAFNDEDISHGAIWGCGGYASAHLVPTTTTFTIAQSDTALYASASVFSSADVGSSIVIQPGGSAYSEAFKITGYVSATQVTVGRAASRTHTAALGAISGITGTINASSNILTINAAVLTSNDIGSVIYVEGAGPTSATTQVATLRTTITGVSGTSITLADNASTTVSAGSGIGGANTGGQVILRPAAEIYYDGTAGNAVNDVIVSALHIEQASGTALVVSGCIEDCRFYGTKLAMGQTSSTYGDDNTSVGQFCGAFFQSEVVMIGSTCENTTVNTVGRVVVEGLGYQDYLGPWQGSLLTGTPAFGTALNAFGSGITVGTINSAAAYDYVGWGGSLYATDGTSGTGFIYGSVGAYNSGITLGEQQLQQITTNHVYSGVSAGINSGDQWASQFSNASGVGMTFKNTNSSGNGHLYLGTDVSSSQSGWVANGSADSAGNGVGTTTLYGRGGLWLSGSATSGTGLSSDTSGNFTENGVFGLTASTWADNQTCTAGQISVDASYIYVCTATNTVKRAALSSF